MALGSAYHMSMQRLLDVTPCYMQGLHRTGAVGTCQTYLLRPLVEP